MAAWNDLGISFGHTEEEYNKYNDTTIRDARLQELWDYGFRKIRMNIPNYSWETSNIEFRDKFRATVVKAIEMGFTVEWGYTVNNGSDLTSTTWTTYSDNIKAIATWINGLGASYVDKFVLSIGNEEDDRVDGTTLTVGTLRTNLKTLATEIKVIDPTLKTSYSFTIAHSSAWATAGSGDIDFMGLNVYSTQALFNQHIRFFKANFGQKAYLSEWNASDFGRQDFASDELFEKEIARRYSFIQDYGIPSYFFGFTFGTTTQYWAMKLTDGSYRNAWKILTRSRRKHWEPRATTETPHRNYMTFNGLASTIDLGDVAASEGVAELTVCYFTRMPNFGGSSQLRKRAANSNWSYALEVNITTNLFSYGVNTASNGVSSVTAPETFSPHEWIHVALVYDGTYENLYINGVWRGRAGRSGVVAGATTNLYLGSNQGSSGFFRGLLSDVRIYTRALTADEILNLSNDVEVSDTGLIRWFKFIPGEQTSMTALKDYSASPTNGTVTQPSYGEDLPLVAREIIDREHIARDSI